jgi:hypothetical protein
MANSAKETVIKIKEGSLVRHLALEKPNDRVREDRLGLTGIVIKISHTPGPLARWSPLCADVVWSDGIMTPGYLVSALELV